MLNPNITKESGTYWLNWTPDPTAEGYAFVTPTGKSRTFDPALARTKLGKNLTEPLAAGVSVLDVTQRPLEVATYPSSAPPTPPPPPGDPGMPDRSLAAWDALLPALTVKTVSTVPDWQKAWGALVAGTLNDTLIDVMSPITIPGLYSKRRFASPAAVRFCDGVTLTDRSYLEGDKLDVFGGTARNIATHGLTTTNCGDVRWWGLTVDGCGGTGYLAHSNVGPNTGLDISLTVTRCGQDLSLDPHAEKGTGLHPWYIGSDDVGGLGTRGDFVLRAHDCPTGAGQIGNKLHDSNLWLDGRRLTFVAHQQVGGNLMQWWGGGNKNVVVHRAYGEDLAGRMSETDGLDSASGIVVEWARGVRCRLSPLYTAHSGVTYKDCA